MAIIRLPRLPSNWKDQPQLFERYWDEAMRSIEKTLNELLSIPAIQDSLDSVATSAADAQAAADAAAAAAVAAQDAADLAQSGVSGNSAELSLANSYVSGFTPPLVTADTAGIVTIGAHTRVYGDSTLNPSVSVAGASVATGAAANDIIRIYYVDAARAGGSVSYLYSIDPAPVALQTGDTHVVGVVTVPTVGSNTGNIIRPPSYLEP